MKITYYLGVISFPYYHIFPYVFLQNKEKGNVYKGYVKDIPLMKIIKKQM